MAPRTYRQPRLPAEEPTDGSDTLAPDAPLAARMRPRTFDEFVGQEHLVGPRKILRRLVEAGQLPSMIFWGPPGSGKTTLARIIAAQSEAHFSPVSAVSAGVADLRRIVAEARARRPEKTILFIDEIHRFNKAQQDAVLPVVEDGTVTLIGATTENPSFEVIGPLLSRSRVFTLHQLTDDDIAVIIRRALADRERGLAGLDVEMDGEAVEALAASVGGDARIALNALEAAVLSLSHKRATSVEQPGGTTERHSEPGEGPSGRDGTVGSGHRVVTREVIEEALQHRTYLYDRQGDAHYDTISAFIKSLRGSDPDGALYWLARMIEAGEDPLFIVRRMVILAAEDVGLADPQALSVAVACQQAVHFIGMPEGFLPMSECALYLALAPKSNSALTSYSRAKADVEATRNDPVPLHLRNAVTGLMHGLGYGRGYQYAHDYEGGIAPDQSYLPDRLKGRKYYQPKAMGREKDMGRGESAADAVKP